VSITKEGSDHHDRHRGRGETGATGATGGVSKNGWNVMKGSHLPKTFEISFKVAQAIYIYIHYIFTLTESLSSWITATPSLRVRCMVVSSSMKELFSLAAHSRPLPGPQESRRRRPPICDLRGGEGGDGREGGESIGG
jgi:hypothetical protein